MKYKKVKINQRNSMSFEEVEKSLNKIGVKLTKTKGSIWDRSWSIISGNNNKK